MLRVLMFDLNETLVHGRTPLPHAREALEALEGFHTADDGPLMTCLLGEVEAPIGSGVEAVFQSFLEELEECGLADLFDPVEQRVTLPQHAGLDKLERRAFETALQRLGACAGLEECLFVTGNPARAAAAADLETLRLGEDFSQWADAPLLLASRIAPLSEENFERALRVQLAAVHQLDLVSVQRQPGSRMVRARVKKWIPLTGIRLGPLEGVHVQLPVEAEIKLDVAGRPESIQDGVPSAADMEEAAAFARGLLENRQVRLASSPAPAATHEVETDPRGRRFLKRRAFYSAA